MRRDPGGDPARPRLALGSTSFSVGFEALDASVTCRPLRQTATPCITNPMTGIVTGPAGEDIHTDAYGRVKVHFRWDRKHPLDDTCSDWIPVCQDNTGHSCSVPRVGWEVLVGFLEGNPDKPVVLGRLYNGADPFPESLPAGKTFSAIRSLSSPGRDGSNLIRTNDATGSEEMFVQAERDQKIVVANDRRSDIVHEEQRLVGGDETITIANNDTTMVGGDIAETIGGNLTRQIGSHRDVSVGGSDSAQVTGNHSLTIGGQHFRRIATDDTVNAETLKEQVGAVILEASAKESSTSAQTAMTLTVGGALVEIARKDRTGGTSGARIETIGGLLFSKSGEGTSLSAGKTRVTTVGGLLTVNATDEIELTGTTSVTMSVAGIGSFVGATKLTLQVGEETHVVLGDGVISIKAKTVTIDATATSDIAVGEATLL